MYVNRVNESTTSILFSSMQECACIHLSFPSRCRCVVLILNYLPVWHIRSCASVTMVLSFYRQQLSTVQHSHALHKYCLPWRPINNLNTEENATEDATVRYGDDRHVPCHVTFFSSDCSNVRLEFCFHWVAELNAEHGSEDASQHCSS